MKKISPITSTFHIHKRKEPYSEKRKTLKRIYIVLPSAASQKLKPVKERRKNKPCHLHIYEWIRMDRVYR